MRLGVHLTILIVFFGGIPTQSFADEVFVRLTTAAQTIKMGDPLFVSVVVFNGSKQGIVIDPYFETKYGTLQFELSSDDEEFRMKRVPMQGTHGPEVSRPRYIRPNLGDAAYEVLWRGEDDFFFPAPGTYRIRAKVALGDKTTDSKLKYIVSDPVTIQVDEVSAAELEIITGDFRKLAVILDPYQLPDDTSPDYLRDLIEQLSDGQLAQTLKWSLLVLKIGGESHAEVLAEIDKIIEKSNPVLADVVRYHLAYRYAALDQWGKVQEVLHSVNLPTERQTQLFRKVKCELDL